MKHIVVVAGVLVRDGRVFAAQRNGKGEVGLKWEFPGGKVEAGERHEAALARELHEELGVVAEVGDFVMTVEHQYTTFALTMHCYRVRITGGDLHLREHLDCRWLGPGDLDSVDWAPADLPVLERVRGLLGEEGVDGSGSEHTEQTGSERV